MGAPPDLDWGEEEPALAIVCKRRVDKAVQLVAVGGEYTKLEVLVEPRRSRGAKGMGDPGCIRTGRVAVGVGTRCGAPSLHSVRARRGRARRARRGKMGSRPPVV